MEETPTPTRPRRRIPRGAVIAIGLVLAVAGIAGLARATGLGGGHFGHGCRGALARDFVQYRLHNAMREVGATAPQEEQVMAILSGLFAKHSEREALHKELHAKAMAALTVDTVDRAALEALRSEVMTHAEAGSKELVAAIADMAEVLTPAQRRQLAEMVKERFE